jgi:hypothetical protein
VWTHLICVKNQNWEQKNGLQTILLQIILTFSCGVWCLPIHTQCKEREVLDHESSFFWQTPNPRKSDFWSLIKHTHHLCFASHSTIPFSASLSSFLFRTLPWHPKHTKGNFNQRHNYWIKISVSNSCPDLVQDVLFLWQDTWAKTITTTRKKKKKGLIFTVCPIPKFVNLV